MFGNKPDFQFNTDDISGSKPRSFARHIWGKETVNANDYSKLQHQHVPEIIPASVQQYNPLTGEPLFKHENTRTKALQRRAIENQQPIQATQQVRLDNLLSQGYYVPSVRHASVTEAKKASAAVGAVEENQNLSQIQAERAASEQLYQQQQQELRNGYLDENKQAELFSANGMIAPSPKSIPVREQPEIPQISARAQNVEASPVYEGSKSLAYIPQYQQNLRIRNSPAETNVKAINGKDYNIVGGFLQDRRVYTRVQPYNHFEERLKQQYLQQQQSRQELDALTPDASRENLQVQPGSLQPRHQYAPSANQYFLQSQNAYPLPAAGNSNISSGNNRYDDIRRTSQLQLQKIGQSMVSLHSDQQQQLGSAGSQASLALPVVQQQSIDGVAGKMNSYAENRNTLFARKLAPVYMAEPVPQPVRIYGAKALKNLDNVRIY